MQIWAIIIVFFLAIGSSCSIGYHLGGICPVLERGINKNIGSARNAYNYVWHEECVSNIDVSF